MVTASSVAGLKVHDIFLILVCFQLGFFGYHFLYQKDDIKLHHEIHHEESKRDFFQPKLNRKPPRQQSFSEEDIETTPLVDAHAGSSHAEEGVQDLIVVAQSNKTADASSLILQEQPLFEEDDENDTGDIFDHNAADGGNASLPPVKQRLNREQKRVLRLQRRQRREGASRANNLTLPLYQQNYFALTRNLYPGFPLVPELLPLKIMMKYVTDHSQQRLERMWMDCGNTTCPALQNINFIVGTYSCPLEAGNRLHKFMNSLIWAVTTKRFFLWRYFDADACRQEEAELATGTCDSFLNTPDDCSDILQLADWVPSWAEWSIKLNLTTAVRACGIGTRNHDAVAFGMDVDEGKPRVLRIGQQLNLETAIVLGNPNNLYAHRLLVKKSSQSTALQLFKQGAYFTYGMLFESLFSLHPSLLPSPEVVKKLQTNADSYFIHSRHPPSRGDASEIGLEIGCMDRLLLQRPNPEDPCIVVIMTDRKETKPLLAAALLQEPYNCTAISANTTQGSASFRTEHGSFAGRGYFDDLALVMQTRTGFLAPHLALRSGIGIRTSSGLPREVVEFRRVLESTSWADVPPYAECVGIMLYDTGVEADNNTVGESGSDAKQVAPVEMARMLQEQE